jgi:Zn finger protein HypA/HybF involved in hydrogenase expression
MHELSIALEVCRIAEERLGAVGAGALVGLEVEVGSEAGVEPDNLAFCLETLLAEPPFRGAKPRIVRRPGDELYLRSLEVADAGPHD